MTNAMRVTATHASLPHQFLFKAIRPIDPLPDRRADAAAFA